MVNILTNQFELAKKDDADRVMIYYSGQGDKDTGGFVTYGGSLSLSSVRLEMKEILEIVKKS